ncbi:MAG TPA: bifunctional serine/threonine-protein kinase/formylglycine-generating enzyme family protein [Anaerolineaceae bacterium]|nr:bifunctional serine/threonine-protein kinase/formylglycine-generating enzyme family protein [Anaerolineaceae bacterium]
MPNLTNQSIGRYHILEQLGQGGMATVYKAYDTRLEREVAVKVIRTDAFPPAVLVRVLKRFEREARSLARLSDPYIVKVHDFGEHEGSPYLVMELHKGGTLKERLGKPVNSREAAQLLLPIAKALAYAHAHGVLHRDVKPSNILINERGEAVLTDFGIAKLLEGEEGHTLTGTGVGVGTPEYMAPEQGLGKEVDGRADVYGLGVVLYEMVTGRKPFEADTPLAVLLKQVNNPLPRPKEYVKDLPQEVEKILFKALAKQPDDRYTDMGEFAGALQKLAGLEILRTAVYLEQSKEGVRGEQGQEPKAKLAVVKPAVEPVKLDHQHIMEEQETIDEIPLQGKENGKNIYSKWLPAWLAVLGSVFTLLLVFAVIVPSVEKNRLEGTTISKTDQAAVVLQTNTAQVKELATGSWTLAPAVTPTLGIGSTLVREKDGMKMVYVPAGEFTMGSNDGWDYEKPVHMVYLDAFWIDQTEVTNAKYAQCVADGACDQPSSSDPYFGKPYFDNYPVTYVNWFDAETYCAWVGGQLPTEAQWEKAARGKEGRTYPWGEEPPDGKLANFADKNTSYDWSDKAVNDGYAESAPVGSYPAGASPYGVLDMAGNLWEWVTDWYDAAYYVSSPNINPQGPTSGLSRVLRGGSWWVNGNYLRSSDRLRDNPGNWDIDYGFRCVQ